MHKISFNWSLPPKESAKCTSLNNHPCQDRPILFSINSYETLFHSFTVTINKYSGSCNAIDDTYAPVCVANKIKNINVEVFNVKAKWSKIS